MFVNLKKSLAPVALYDSKITSSKYVWNIKFNIGECTEEISNDVGKPLKASAKVWL